MNLVSVYGFTIIRWYSFFELKYVYYEICLECVYYCAVHTLTEIHVNAIVFRLNFEMKSEILGVFLACYTDQVAHSNLVSCLFSTSISIPTSCFFLPSACFIFKE